MSEPNSPREAVEQHRASMAEQKAEQKTPAKFKTGDVVVLRSGGPQMTVFCAGTDSRCLVETEWFVGGVLSRDVFLEAELEHAPPKETPVGAKETA